MLPYEAEVLDEIARTHRTQLAEMTALHDAVVGMMTVTEWTIPKSALAQPIVVEILRHLLTKAIKTFRSIQILCERGLHEDANALARVLLETTAAGLFILQRRRKDPKTRALTPTAAQRATLFYAYSLQQSLKMLNEWKRTRGLKRFATKDMIARTQQTIDAVKAKLPVGANFKDHWSGKANLKDAMKALRQDVMYQVLYRHTSSIAHVSDVGLHFEAHPTGELVWEVGPRAKGFEGPATVSCVLLWALADRIDSRLRLGFTPLLAPHKPKGVVRA